MACAYMAKHLRLGDGRFAASDNDTLHAHEMQHFIRPMKLAEEGRRCVLQDGPVLVCQWGAGPT